MCLAAEYADNLIQLFDQINEKYNKLRNLQSEYDTKLSQLYHEIECNRYSASAGFLKFRELQTLLRERRIIKQELGSIQNLVESVNLVGISNSTRKVSTKIKKYDRGNQKYRDGWDIHIEDIILH